METTVFLFHPDVAILTSIRHWLKAGQPTSKSATCRPDFQIDMDKERATTEASALLCS